MHRKIRLNKEAMHALWFCNIAMFSFNMFFFFISVHNCFRYLFYPALACLLLCLIHVYVISNFRACF